MYCSKVRIEKKVISLGYNIRTVLSVSIIATMMIATAATASTFYARTNLTSDVSGVAAFTDTNLAGAWGVARSPTSPWWVNSTVGGASLVLSGAGQPFPTNAPLVVKIPPVPSEASGIVFNGGGGFNVASNASAIFIFVTLNGTISGWSPGQANHSLAVLKVTGGGTASYTGVAIASWNGTNRLYVANYGQNSVDVFDQNFNPVTLSSNAFTDADVPADLKVFNVQLIGSNLLFVTYAPTNVFGNGTAPGAGYVAVYAANGILLGHLRHGLWMNAPWGVVSAPDRDGDAVFVGMFGDGTIAEFDGERGHFRGLLRDEEGGPITIGKGLWGLGFGNGASAGPTNVLYFAADMVTTNGFHGIFGALTPVARGSDEDDRNKDDKGRGEDNGQGDDR